MSDLFFCCNCDGVIELSKHGRCATCDSDAVLRRALGHLELVARLYPATYEDTLDVKELEQLWRKS